MIYTYKCPECGKLKEENMTVDEMENAEVYCEECKVKMNRYWKAGIRVGEGNRSDDIQSTSFTKERLKIRPSGKTQIYY